MTIASSTSSVSAATRRVHLENYLRDRPLVRISGNDLDRENKHFYMPYPMDDVSHAVINKKVIEDVTAIGKPKIIEIPIDGSYQDVLEVMLRERGLPNQFKKTPPEIDLGSVFATRGGFINAYEVGDMWLMSRGKRYTSAQFFEIGNIHVALRLFEEQLEYHGMSLRKVVKFLEKL